MATFQLFFHLDRAKDLSAPLYMCWGVSVIEADALLVIASVIWFGGCVWRQDVTVVLTGCHFGTTASDIVK